MAKNVQIPQELLIDLYLYFDNTRLAYSPREEQERLERIQKGIQAKIDAMMRNWYFTKYKTAPSDEEREEYRQKYLAEIGISEQFKTSSEVKYQDL